MAVLSQTRSRSCGACNTVRHSVPIMVQGHRAHLDARAQRRRLKFRSNCRPRINEARVQKAQPQRIPLQLRFIVACDRTALPQSFPVATSGGVSASCRAPPPLGRQTRPLGVWASPSPPGTRRPVQYYSDLSCSALICASTSPSSRSMISRRASSAALRPSRSHSVVPWPVPGLLKAGQWTVGPALRLVVLLHRVYRSRRSALFR